MCRSDILLHPALGTKLDSVVCITVVVFHLGSTAGEGGILDIIHRILHISYHILQAVDLILHASDVRKNRAHNVDCSIFTLVSGEGTYSLAILLDGECGVVHCRERGIVPESSSGSDRHRYGS